ncbi:hypothetical protein [Pseudoalteromonas sp. NBT06-2]|uniref:hypothetical protein n=1 Tax=Pseudoalteromonas sp. NBT06-2 TaxID=2025950 RepID=UPI001483AD64|nr:hypothetical protein [Pseudoalteromonas sp. NBT06-2]
MSVVIMTLSLSRTAQNGTFAKFGSERRRDGRSNSFLDKIQSDWQLYLYEKLL